MRDLMFLWKESDRWIAQAPYGPMGEGASQELALAALRVALLERPRRKPERESLLDEILRTDRAELARRRTQDVEDIGLDRCLHISLAAFESMLDRQFPRVAPESPMGAIQEYPYSSFFRRQRIIEITSARYELEAGVLPFGGSFGLFSFDGEQLLCLNRQVENLQRLFEREQRPIDEADPSDLAQLVAEAAGRRVNNAHKLVTADALEQLESDGYELDRSELARIRTAIVPASVSSDADGWVLRFTTVWGWMHELQEVFSWQVGFSRSFQLDVQQRSLSKRIFVRVPLIQY